MTLQDPWDDPRLRNAELAAFNGERAARRGSREEARTLWTEAAAGYGDVAREVEAHPRTRAILAVSAVVCWAHSGDRSRAVEEARFFLSAPHPLPDEGAEELRSLADRYSQPEDLP